MTNYDSFPLSERRVLRKIDAIPQSISERDINQLSNSFSDLDGEQKETIVDALESSALNSESADQQAVNSLFDFLEKDEDVRTHIAQSLRLIASEKPNLLSTNVEPLYDLLDQNSKAAVPATEALQHVLIANPNLGVQSAEMLIDIIDTVHREEKPDTLDRVLKMSDHDVVSEAATTIVNRLESDQAEQRAAAARNLGWIGSTDLEMVCDDVEKLIYKIDDEEIVVRKAVLLAIQEIVEANPEFSDWNLDAVLNCVFDDDPDVRRLTLELCRCIAADNPKMLETHLPSIITRIDPNRESVDEVRQTAAHTLQDISEVRPEMLATDEILDYIMMCYDHTDINIVRVPVIDFLTSLIKEDSVNLDFNPDSIESLLTDDAPQIKVQGWMILPRLVRNTDYSIGTARVVELFPTSECSPDVRLVAVKAVDKLISDTAIRPTPTLVDTLILTTLGANNELTEAALNVVNNFPAPDDTSPPESRSRALDTLAGHVGAAPPVGTSASCIVARFAKHDPEMVATADRIDMLVTGLAEQATDGSHEAIQSLAAIAMERPQALSTEAMTALSTDLPEQISVLLEDGSAELQKACAKLLARMSNAGVELPETIVEKLVDVDEYDSTEVQRVVVDSLETIAQDQPSTLLNTSDMISALFSDICCHDDSFIRVYGLRAARSLVNEDPNILLKSESELRPAIVKAVTHNHTETSVTGMLTVIELANDDLNLLLESNIWDTIATSLQADAAIMRATACRCIQTVISETTDINQILEEKELSAVPNLLSDSDPRVRREAHKVISELGENHAALGIERYELIPLIFDSLTDEDAEVRAEAILSIQAVERSDAYVIGIVSNLISRLTDPNSLVRKRAASKLRRLARTEPKRFKRVVENIVEIHKMGFEDSQQLARELLAIISDREPELVEPFLDSLVGTAGTGPERGGSAVLETLQHIGANSPETLNNRELLTDIRKQALSHPDPEIREESARVLNAVAGAEFQYVKDELDALVDILNNAESEKIKRAAVALRVVASDVTETPERIINRGGVDIIQ